MNAAYARTLRRTCEDLLDRQVERVEDDHQARVRVDQDVLAVHAEVHAHPLRLRQLPCSLPTTKKPK